MLELILVGAAVVAVACAGVGLGLRLMFPSAHTPRWH